jgi:Caudovirus prohead serine protease
MASKSPVATIRSVFLASGVSLNNRLYTPELIGKAVKRMEAKIADGTAPPLAMLTSHGTDSVLDTVGRLTAVGQRDDGSGWFESQVPDTAKGRDLTALTEHGYVRNVSINGEWLGETRTETVDGKEVFTGDDLDIFRVDFVPDPGVVQARIEDVQIAEGRTDGFRDEFPATLEVDEATGKPYGNVMYADPGYQKDGVKRYPLDTDAHIRAAWSYINQAKNASKYSSSDLAKIKAKIRAAMKRIGADVSDAAERTPVTEAGDRDGETAPSEHVCEADYTALVALDPDGDGDVDGWACPTCGAIRPERSPDKNPDSDAVTPDDMQSATTVQPTQEAIPVSRTLSDADVAAIAEALRPMPVEPDPSPDPEPTEPTAPEPEAAPSPSLAEVIAAEVKKARDEIREEVLAAYGPPRRKGYVRPAEGALSKPLHQLSREEYDVARREFADAVLPTE